MSTPYIGEIHIFPYTFAPRNWAECNGQTIPVEQNPALFALLGAIYGGNGRTTFAVPDLQGRAPLHVGGSGSATGPGLSPRSLGQRLGTATETLTASHLPSHTHAVQAANEAGNSTSPTGRFPSQDTQFTREYIETSPDTTLASDAIATTGGQAHENRQPYLPLRFCIALDGIYPTPS